MTIIADKEEKLMFVATELERTQKALRLLNNKTSRLEHLITSGRSFGDQNGIGFKGKSSGTKTMFIKSGLLV